eukprot:gb/GECG01015091.1/.p1 GENE.gb/GECG01015091.1/~~gb/GECG01015091.1/.p1  ORF type:complete len:347 (+),score=46.94 gb/GECG01015091.1/:1-1041(+)
MLRMGILSRPWGCCTQTQRLISCHTPKLRIQEQQTAWKCLLPNSYNNRRTEIRPFSAAAAAAAAAAKKGSSSPKQTKKKKKKGMQFKRRRVQTYPIDEVLRLVKSQAIARFDETVDLSLQLGVDPRKSHENVRGVVNLPHGTGKDVRVAVFARGDAAEAAREAGADVVGADELVEQIQKGDLNFEKTIATPDMMQIVGRVARILGPRGMMPNPKLGTVTNDTATAVKSAKAGQVQFRNEKQGILHAPLGKASWEAWKLKANLRALMLALQASKPDTLKGIFFRKATISTTQGRGFHVDMSTIDPGKARFMIKTEPIGEQVPFYGTFDREQQKSSSSANETSSNSRA